MTSTDNPEPAATSTNLDEHQEAILAVMHRWRSEGAHWTSDLAHGARLSTNVARRKLQQLEAAGKVRKVVTGNPTSWELTGV